MQRRHTRQPARSQRTTHADLRKRNRPERLRLMPLPWANKEPDRPAPTELPRPQEPDKRLDIAGVGRLKEWKEVENAVRSTQKDLTHSGDLRHRPRRAEGRRRDRRRRGTCATHRRHDTRHQSSTKQRRHHRLDQGGGPRLDDADAKRSKAHKHRRESNKPCNKLQRQRNFIRVETRSKRDTSTCSNSVRVSSHHGGVYEHQKQVRKPTPPPNHSRTNQHRERYSQQTQNVLHKRTPP